MAQKVTVTNPQREEKLSFSRLSASLLRLLRPAFVLPSWPVLRLHDHTLIWFNNLALINEIVKTSFPIPYIIEKELSKEKCCIFVHQVLRK